MIRTNIWIVFCIYTIYALISIPLFILTSGGWISIFFYIGIAGIFYIISTILLFVSATNRTSRRKTNVKIKLRLLLIILGLQVFVLVFNYGSCGQEICTEGFLPSILAEASLPIILAPPFVVVVFALLLYLGFLSLFLFDLA